MNMNSNPNNTLNDLLKNLTHHKKKESSEKYIYALCYWVILFLRNPTTSGNQFSRTHHYLQYRS